MLQPSACPKTAPIVVRLNFQIKAGCLVQRRKLFNFDVSAIFNSLTITSRDEVVLFL